MNGKRPVVVDSGTKWEENSPERKYSKGGGLVFDKTTPY